MEYHKLLRSEYNILAPLIPPFDIGEELKVDQSSPYFDDCLYKMYEIGEKSLSPMSATQRAISRLATAELHLEYKGFGGYGFAENGDFFCDYYDGRKDEYQKIVGNDCDFTKERHTIIQISERDGNFEMYGVCLDPYGGEGPYIIKEAGENDSSKKTATAAIYALLAYIVAKASTGDSKGRYVTSVIRKHYNDILQAIDSLNYPLLHKAALALDGDIYSLLQYPEKLAGGIKIKHPGELGLLPFDPAAVNSTELTGTVNLRTLPKLQSMVGSSVILSGEKVEKAPVEINLKPLKGATVADHVNAGTFDLGIAFTDEEKELIPKGFDNFVCDPIVLDTANEIKESRFDPRPCRNIMWTGESGTGKTTSAMMLANLLGLPYYSMNLSSDKLSSDILTSCLPNNKKVSVKEIEEMFSDFPSDFEIQMEPEETYEKLTGIAKKGASEEDIRHAMAKKMLDTVNRASDFMYVDSPFVTAYRKGGLVELQECNSAKAQVLKSLNEALDDTSVIHLPTGEVVRRNENCIVVVTANIGSGYRGIEDFSNDFIARMDQHDRFTLPDDKELIERVIDRSGYTNKDNIKKMIAVMKAIQKVLLEIRGDYGSCSPRALYSWARKTKNCGKPYYAGLKTIVGLATQDPEEEVELIAQLEQYFKKDDVA